MDWLSDNPWAIWFAIAVLLAVIEMFSLDLVLLMFAIGAGAAAIVAGFGAPFWLAIIVFAAVSGFLLLLVRPPLVEKLHAGPTLKQGHDHEVGQRGIVVEPVDRYNGRIRLSGDIWSARTDDPALTLDVGAEVDVTAIDGATAVVVPAPSTTQPEEA